MEVLRGVESEGTGKVLHILNGICTRRQDEEDRCLWCGVSIGRGKDLICTAGVIALDEGGTIRKSTLDEVVKSYRKTIRSEATSYEHLLERLRLKFLPVERQLFVLRS